MRRRLDDLRAEVFETGLTSEQRDTRVLVYLTVRARLPWSAIAWHDFCRAVRGPDYLVHEGRSEVEVWNHHLDRLGLDYAHRRPSCPLVRP